LPPHHGVLGMHAVDQLIDVGREIVLSAICLIAHLIQALLLGHHCLRGSSGSAVQIVSRSGACGSRQPLVRARKSSAPPTSSMCPVSTSAVAIAATSAANSSTE